MRFPISTIDPETAVEQSDVHMLDVTPEGAGLRIIFDPDGSCQEHDLLIERWPDRWALLVHAYGGDPVIVAEVLPNRLDVRDAAGQVLLTIPVGTAEAGEINVI